jgi:hypothetical protein
MDKVIREHIHTIHHGLNLQRSPPMLDSFHIFMKIYDSNFLLKLWTHT